MKSQSSNVSTVGWYPLVFAAAFPVTVYSHNQAAFAAVETLRPLVFFVVLAFGLLLLLRAVFGKGGIAEMATAVIMVGIWTLGYGSMLHLVVAITLVAAYYLRRSTAPAKLTPILNALSVGVLVLPLVTIFLVQRAAHDNASLASIPFSPFVDLVDEDMSEIRPDIYHIVLDAYAGEAALNDVLGFDNSGFFDELASLGFRVNRSMRVPYNETVHTMSAVFLGDYLVPGEYPIDSDLPTRLRSTLGALIPNGPVHELLRNNGYTVLNTETGHNFLRFRNSTEVVSSSRNWWRLTRYETYLAELAGLDRVIPGIQRIDRQNPLIRAVKNAFDIDYDTFDSPRFVYQHMLAPHTPFTIDRNGDPTDAFPGFANTTEGDRVVMGDPALRDLYVAGYLEKLRYVNDRLITQLKRIQASPNPKVIFVHGDHGSGSRYWLDEPDRTCKKERFVSFMAVYSDVPELSAEFVWLEDEDATLVSLYRSLLNGLVDTDFSPLEAKSHYVRYSTPHTVLPLQAEQILANCS
ncbi:MAG: hypothetical protein AAGA44_04200 [Pseudomonadota bacterium]